MPAWHRRRVDKLLAMAPRLLKVCGGPQELAASVTGSQCSRSRLRAGKTQLYITLLFRILKVFRYHGPKNTIKKKATGLHEDYAYSCNATMYVERYNFQIQ